MSEIQKIEIEPTYRKDNGLWVLQINESFLPQDFHLMEQSVVYIPPTQLGGNHKHPRSEIFIGLHPDLKLIWLDVNGNRYEEHMYDDEKIWMFIVAPFVPHAVVNMSEVQSAILYEFADEKQHDVEAVEVFKR